MIAESRGNTTHAKRAAQTHMGACSGQACVRETQLISSGSMNRNDVKIENAVKSVVSRIGMGSHGLRESLSATDDGLRNLFNASSETEGVKGQVHHANMCFAR